MSLNFVLHVSIRFPSVHSFATLLHTAPVTASNYLSTGQCHFYTSPVLLNLLVFLFCRGWDGCFLDFHSAVGFYSGNLFLRLVRKLCLLSIYILVLPTMNKDEKEIIRTNRRFIKENVSNIDKVADILYEKGILSMDNKEFVAVSCFFFITLVFLCA